MPFLLVLLSYLLFAPAANADGVGYDGKVSFSARTDKLLVKHSHDWSQNTEKERWNRFVLSPLPLTMPNSFSSIAAFDARSRAKIFESPSPALTQIWISPDSHYILGLSNIKVWNPYQAVLWDAKGNLLSAWHISAVEACMSPEEFAGLLAEYPAVVTMAREHSVTKEDSVFLGDTVFLDVVSPISIVLGRKGLGKHLLHYCKSHHADDIHWSVTNSVWWYDEKKPAPKLIFKGNELVGISIRSISGKRINLTLHQP
jgi:hypothetical protein